MKKEEENKARDLARKLRDMAEAEGFLAIVALDGHENLYVAHTSGDAREHLALAQWSVKQMRQAIKEADKTP